MRARASLLGLLSALAPLAVPAAPPMPSAPYLPPAPAGGYVPPLQPPRPPQLPAHSTEFVKIVARQFTSVQQLDEALDALRQTSWQLHSTFGPLKDLRGKTAGEDVDRWLLTPDHDAELKDLRARAAAYADKGARNDLLMTLNKATGLVEEESYLASVVSTYWSLWSVTLQHFSNLRSIAERIAPPAPMKDSAVDMIGPAVAKDYEHALGARTPGLQASEIEVLNNDRRNLLHALNEARGRYAARLSEQQRAQGGEQLRQPREAPCPEAVTQSSGTATPTFAAGNAAPDSFYPDSSRRAEYEGSVTVKAWVSATGCVQQASVYTSSGVAELDEAAMRWTQQARFRPAERDHQPADGSLLFAVKFQLRN